MVPLSSSYSSLTDTKGWPVRKDPKQNIPAKISHTKKILGGDIFLKISDIFVWEGGGRRGVVR